MSSPKFKSAYIVFSAPSGTGKTTIVERLAEKYENIVISVSATTRSRRPAERDGIAYHFLTEEEFIDSTDKNAFLEYENVHGCYYGTLKKTVDEHVQTGKTVVFDIDVNGAIAIKNNLPNAILIFLKPPNREELVNRLKNRKTETEQSIGSRLKRLEFEYRKAELFDHIVINDRLDEAIRTIEKIIIEKTS